MKKRTQLIILSVLIFIAVLVILSSSIFSFSEIGVDYITTKVNTNITSEELLSDSNLKFGKSIFSINKNSATSSIEKNNPYIKVVNVETVFPNKLIFHIAEREELFVVKLLNNYLILDEDGKVLAVDDSYVNTAENAILLQNININESVSQNNNDTQYQAGNFVAKTSNIKNLVTVLKEWKTSNVHLKAHIISIVGDGENLIFNMRCGLTIKIFKSSISLSDKVNLAFSIYEKADDIENKTLLEIRNVKNTNNEYELKGFIS